MPIWLILLVQFAAIAYALVGGAFVAFSDFIMRSLGKTGGVGGIDAMQSINREVYRWIFMTLFIGLVPVSLVFIGYAALNPGLPASPVLAAAGLIYVIGCFAVTAGFNVPMNERLAKMDLANPETGTYWTGVYLPRWTFWNSVRAAACVLSAVLMLVSVTWMTGAAGAV